MTEKITLPTEVAALLRQLHAAADVPALFLSARDADADRLLAKPMGLPRGLRGGSL